MLEQIKSYIMKEGWPLEVLGLFAGVFVLNIVIKAVLRWLYVRYKSKDGMWRASFFDALFLPLSLYLWFFAIVYSIYLIDSRLNKTPVLGDLPLTVIVVGGIASFGWFILRWKNRILAEISYQKYWEKTGLDESHTNALDKLLTIVIVFIFLVWLLQAMGQGIGAILTLGGIGAAAVGFASKEFIANFFGGFVLYLTRPFKIGDAIKLESKDTMGLVEEIGWYMTRIRDFEKQTIYIPNSMFSQFILINMTERSHRLIKETVGIRYRDFSSLGAILSEIRQYVAEHPDLDNTLTQWANFTAYADSSLDMTLFSYTKTTAYDAFSALKENLLLKVFEIVQKHGADFAFPTITLDTDKE